MKRIVLAAALLAALPAFGQAFPTKPIRLVVPLGPGGGYDFVGRLMGEGLSHELGQPVVVENRTGAGTVVGTTSVAKSAPDGYTIVVGGVGSIAQTAALTKDLPFDPAADLVALQLVDRKSTRLNSSH